MQNDHIILLQGGISGGFARLLLMKNRPPFPQWVVGLLVGVTCAYFIGGAIAEYFAMQPKATAATAFVVGSLGEFSLLIAQGLFRKWAAKFAEDEK